MPTFFICFILFILWFRVKTKQSSKEENKSIEEFLTREQEANFTRKKDISNLEYISVNMEILPFSDTTDEYEIQLENNVKKFADKKLLNLSGLTNTDIKLLYGSANLDILSSYDQNYTLLLRDLNKWGAYLFQKERYSDSKTVLEYALSLGSDITETYTTLAKIYLSEDSPEKVQKLIEQISESDAYLKDSIKLSLIKLLQEY
ncbi:MAG: hypothetical protein II374_00485 [Lachnospiraceae bacterium]|nr:hypothetical protein [Lachnospiraceae bacterium]MBQ2319797.1 hypothetical protein [Lachnospiraceae bacterium]